MSAIAFVQEAKVVDTYANCFVKRDRLSGSIQIASQENESAETSDHSSSLIRQPIDFSKLTDTDREETDV